MHTLECDTLFCCIYSVGCVRFCWIARIFNATGRTKAFSKPCHMINALILLEILECLICRKNALDGRVIAARGQKLSTVRKKRRGAAQGHQDIRKTSSWNSRPIHRMCPISKTYGCMSIRLALPSDYTGSLLFRKSSYEHLYFFVPSKMETPMFVATHTHVYV